MHLYASLTYIIHRGEANAQTFRGPQAQQAAQTASHRRARHQQHALFQHAADLQGRSLTDFVLATLQKEAVQTIETMEIIRLNAEESRKLAEVLLGPPREPSENQLAIKKRCLETVRHK